MKGMKQEIGVRKTNQREVIYEIIRTAAGPLTVYEMLHLANLKEKKTAIATIYRTVKLLLEKGEIKTVNLPDGQVRYSLPSEKHHHYFHCNSCDIVLEVDHCCMHLHRKDVDGHLVESHEITLLGTCKSCL